MKWEGESLIIRTGRYSGPPQQTTPDTDHDEQWSFDPAGRLSITITESIAGLAGRICRAQTARDSGIQGIQGFTMRDSRSGISDKGFKCRRWESNPHSPKGTGF